jgi:hypothetical protein
VHNKSTPFSKKKGVSLQILINLSLATEKREKEKELYFPEQKRNTDDGTR